jgi:hypothetical protein
MSSQVWLPQCYPWHALQITKKMNPFCDIFNLFMSISSLVTNGWLCLRASENKHFHLWGAISLKFKPLLTMHLPKPFTMQILYCLFTIKPSISPYINKFMLTLHISSQYCFQFEQRVYQFRKGKNNENLLSEFYQQNSKGSQYLNSLTTVRTCNSWLIESENIWSD